MRTLKQKEFTQQFVHNNRVNYFVALFAQLITSAAMIASAPVMMYSFDAMAQADYNLLKIVLAAALLLLIVYGIMGVVQKVFVNRYMKKALSQFKGYIFEKILKKSIEEFGSYSSGKFINAFSNDLSLIEQNYLRGNLLIIQNLVMITIAISVMTYLNPVFMLIVVASCIIPIIVALLIGNRLTSKEKKTSDENEGFIDQVKDLINGFIIIKSFKAEKKALELFSQRNFSLEKTKGDRRETNDAVVLASMVANTVVIIVIVLIGAFFVISGTMTIGAVIAFIQLSNYLVYPIREIVPLWSSRKASIALIDKLTDIIRAEPRLRNRKEIGSLNQHIRLQDVSFSYDGKKNVLSGINITFEKGKSYAIVGTSGSGKSTLLQLIMGYNSGYGGSIFIDHTELREIDLDSLYDVISVVQQNVFLFHSSIKNNITMFTEFEDQKVACAVGRSGLAGLIAEKGLDYNCGEGGCNLSGGEKQRVSIARCLLRETPVLLMDEATASLDNTTAFELTNEILDIRELTRIVVTHKLEEKLIQKFDEIIVIHAGAVAERGTFTQLAAEKGYFYSLLINR